MNRNQKITDAVGFALLLGLLSVSVVFGKVPPHSPTPQQWLDGGGDSALVAPTLGEVFSVMAIPSPTSPTDPVFPESMIPESLKEQYQAKALIEARKGIDVEHRPKVYFQKKADLTSTNEWETILMIEPWRIAENYRVIIK